MAIMWRENTQTRTTDKVWRPGVVASVGQNEGGYFAFITYGEVRALMNGAQLLTVPQDSRIIGLEGDYFYKQGFDNQASAMQWADNKSREL